MRGRYFNRSKKHFHRPVKKRSFRHFFPFFLCLIPLVLVFFLFKSSFFSVKSIDCSLDGQKCHDDQLAFISSQLNKNYFLLKPNKLSQDLLDADRSLSDAKIELIFPNKLKVSLFSDPQIITIGVLKPVDLPDFEVETATSSSQSSQKLNSDIVNFNNLDLVEAEFVGLTDKGHLVTKKSESSNLYFMGNPENEIETLTNLFKYQQEIEKSALTFKKAIFIGKKLIILFRSGTYVFFDVTLPPRPIIATLQQIHAEATIDTDHAIIDMRWNKPVISTY